MEKKTRHPKKKKPANFQDDLCDFGKKLKDWNGKDFDEIAKPFKTVLKTSMSAFNETNDSGFLLFYLILQTILSYVITRGLMSNVIFKTEYEFPKSTISQLGDRIIDLSQNVNQPAFLSALLSLLAFAYQNNLIPTIPTS
jgi:hypothetical protein